MTKTWKLDTGCFAAFFLYAASAVITPICLPQITQELGASLSEGGGLETGRTLIIMAVLLVTVLWGHHWGKTRWLGGGFFLLAAGLFLASVSRGYGSLLAGLMLSGFGGGFTEALGNPLVQELHPRDAGKYLNISNAFYSLGVLFPVLLFGELLTQGLSWRLLYRLTAMGALGIGLLFTTAKGPAPRNEGSLLHAMSRIIKNPLFWLYAVMIFLAGGIEAGFTFWSATYIQGYLLDIPRAGALGTAAFGGAMAAGRILSGKLADRIPLSKILLSGSFLGILISLLMPLADSLLLLYGFLILAGFSAAALWPSILAEAGEALPQDTTRLFILLASLGMAGYGAVPFLMGLWGDKFGLQESFRLLPLLFLVVAALLLTARRITQKRSLQRESTQ